MQTADFAKVVEDVLGEVIEAVCVSTEKPSAEQDIAELTQDLLTAAQQIAELTHVPLEDVQEPDLVGRMRRFSTESDMSSYSIVSSAPSVHSLDSNGLLTTEVADDAAIVEQAESSAQVSDTSESTPTRQLLDLVPTPEANVPEAALPTVKHRAPLSLVPIPEGQTYKPDPPTIEQEDENDEAPVAVVSKFWLQFPDFVPVATATFNAEFRRLAKLRGWNAKDQKKHRVEALNAEVAFHYGMCLDKLDRWQQLCADVGIKNAPTSITKCRKALRPVMVNLHNLIDHRRNPNTEVRRFKTCSEFSKYTSKGRTFPRECAKQDGFIKVLLKKM
ncbi:hypothetical protein CC86DRAFT_432475 [Ophiobolus disseminans]|uniref:Uncharacterized protein n=1 Tax=Ophiobolus disseminans TaxID=1469910 RepID=A0A6A6ZDE8_9PLEO|nr:hypothetical protein CC86DRAFT_432475 [Ophiobolus disseminans]